MEDTSLTKKDFDLSKEYKMFDVLYSVHKEDLTEIKCWTVIGHCLSTSLDKRKYEYMLIPYPISSYVMQNTPVYLSTLIGRGSFIGKTKLEVIQLAKSMVNDMFNEKIAILEKLR